MTTLRASVKINTRPTIAQFQKLQTVLDDDEVAKFLAESVRPYLSDRAVLRFSQEGDDMSGPWAPLRLATRGIRAQQARFYGWPIKPAHPINVRSGELKRFIIDTYSIQRYSTGPRLTIPRMGGNRKLQAKFRAAQVGAAPNTVPRPVVGLGARDQADIETLWGRWIQNVLRSL